MKRISSPATRGMQLAAGPAVLCMAVELWPHAAADDLPPPPSAISMPDTTLYLEPVVNGRQTGKVVPVTYRGGHYYLTPQQLSDAACRWRTSKRKRSPSINWIRSTSPTAAKRSSC